MELVTSHSVHMRSALRMVGKTVPFQYFIIITGIDGEQKPIIQFSDFL